MALLDKVKVACRVTTTAYDDELNTLIASAFADMGITDINDDLLTANNTLPLIETAVKTYCRIHFPFQSYGVESIDRLVASYNEMKAQMLMSSQYREDDDA